MAERPDLERFIDGLPDPQGARRFVSRLEGSGARFESKGLARLLTLAAHSPFLAENLLRRPDDIDWLLGEDPGKGKSREEFSQDLARFATRALGIDEKTLLVRFKRRELSRIYLRDCLGIATLSEVTAELSGLADVILEYALNHARRQLTNLHGTPQVRDERGRVTEAGFAVLAMGKLGCNELNYASDIDLMFLYSGGGETSGDIMRSNPPIANKEYFTGVAERVVRMISGASGEGAIYRIDLRLRPYGRDGDLVWETGRAAQYYALRAENWERQALIRARWAAGQEWVAREFLEAAAREVFRGTDVRASLREVRKAREKIEREVSDRRRGFNVKLGGGGIREVEFIAQALQLAHGGREPWVRSSQTLIVLARLAEKGYLTESERARLSAAYTFLRTVEHRLQMEHGVQTHTVPENIDRRKLLALRCGFKKDPDPVAQFDSALRSHTEAVRAVYDRVFDEFGDQDQFSAGSARPIPVGDENERLIFRALESLNRLLEPDQSREGQADIDRSIRTSLDRAISPARSLRNLATWADSLATAGPRPISIERMAQVIGGLLPMLSSQYLSHVLTSRPELAFAIPETAVARDVDEIRRRMLESMSGAEGPQARQAALRREWYRAVTGIAYRDLVSARTGKTQSREPEETFDLSSIEIPHPDPALRANNLEQTALAEASVALALDIALESIGSAAVSRDRLPFAILALGRLGHAGMDYGSDLDLLMVYEDEALPPEAEAGTPAEYYSSVGAALIRVLSSITQDGYLYSVDLRLRPEGRSGSLVHGLSSLISYIRDRASAWEHSAYLKVREVAGNLDLGRRARTAICSAVFDAAKSNQSLREELSGMRSRLEKEKARFNPRDIKWGPGGMMDVYFITRYLQMKTGLYVAPELGTMALVVELGRSGALDRESCRTLFLGYSFLRRVDHWMRLLLDRPRAVLPSSPQALSDLTRAMGLDSVEELERLYLEHASGIRSVYLSVFAPS